nr:MAG TPA: hypothetical protein [Caudoviricetes sp.]
MKKSKEQATKPKRSERKFEMEAQEIIIDVVRSNIALINAMRNKAPAEKVTMFRHELNGMIVCLTQKRVLRRQRP